MCREYESGCGWNDFYTDSDDLEYLKNILLQIVVEKSTYTGQYWYHIADMETGTIILNENDMGPEKSNVSPS